MIMKKILLYAAALTLLFAACKKDDEMATKYIVSPSFPVIDFGSGGQFFSINTGGGLPTVAATAYDSTLKESYPVSIVGTDALDNTTPGLYIISAKATNKYGYYTNANVYIAVTNIAASKDISGHYKRVDVATGDVANVTKLANGLYQTDNVAGASRTGRPDLLYPILFVQKDDSTLLFPDQDSPFGTMKFKDAKNIPMQASFQSIPGDTSYRYAITAPSSAFGGAIRKFKKQ